MIIKRNRAGKSMEHEVAKVEVENERFKKS